MAMKVTTKFRALLSTAAVILLAAGAALMVAGDSDEAVAHKAKHSAAQLNAFNEVFMEQVRMGDRLFHGDAQAQEQLGVKLSSTGMACAMCHPMAADTHPQEFPKFQEQMNAFATLRDMTNWCIEKPNQGEKIDANGEAMKALEAYMIWSNRGSALTPGTH
jgi:thiosulfate dehydrogenase